jgi:hypothetical protein
MQIHKQRDAYKDKAEFLEAEFKRLLEYVNCSKFHYDPTVQTADINLRINESLATLHKYEKI